MNWDLCFHGIYNQKSPKSKGKWMTVNGRSWGKTENWGSVG